MDYSENKIKIKKTSIKNFSQIKNKYKEIQFNVLSGKDIKFLLYISFHDIIEMDLTEITLPFLKIKLIKELDLYAYSINRYNIYKYKYLNNLNEENF